MIRLPNKPTAHEIRVCDLREGDIAVVTFPHYGTQLVYVFRTTAHSALDMVSLSETKMYWGEIRYINIKVDRILQPGETLTIN